MNISIQLKRDQYNIFTDFCAQEHIAEQEFQHNGIGGNVTVTADLLTFQLFYRYATQKIQTDKWSWCRIDEFSHKEVFSYKWGLYEDLMTRLSHTAGVVVE
ncbi:MAG: hypothetical protein SOZ00_04535 [Tidjanibacter sp.]|nr:hypothetical protein [Tidjanibacter sp.]